MCRSTFSLTIAHLLHKDVWYFFSGLELFVSSYMVESRLQFAIFFSQIEYAKSNIGSTKDKATSKMVATQDKINQIWEEINREDAEEIEMENFAVKEEDREEPLPKTVSGEVQVDSVVSQHYLILTILLL